jgi:hypothetical protein
MVTTLVIRIALRLDTEQEQLEGLVDRERLIRILVDLRRRDDFVTERPELMSFTTS